MKRTLEIPLCGRELKIVPEALKPDVITSRDSGGIEREGCWHIEKKK